MNFVEQHGEIFGPFSFDYACRLCGLLNFLNPGTATIRDRYGVGIQ